MHIVKDWLWSCEREADREWERKVGRAWSQGGGEEGRRGKGMCFLLGPGCVSSLNYSWGGAHVRGLQTGALLRPPSKSKTAIPTMHQQRPLSPDSLPLLPRCFLLCVRELRRRPAGQSIHTCFLDTYIHTFTHQ